MPVQTGTLVEAILRDLARAIVMRPERVRVERRDPVVGETLWWVSCAPEDQGKLIGRQRSHTKAFDLIVAAMGEEAGETWKFKFERILIFADPTPPAQRPKWHDPRPAHELLVRLLAQLPVEHCIVENPRPDKEDPLSFHFDIKTSNLHPFFQRRFQPGFPDEPDSNLIGALGTLFRAASRRAGVRYQLNLIPQ